MKEKTYCSTWQNFPKWQERYKVDLFCLDNFRWNCFKVNRCPWRSKHIDLKDVSILPWKKITCINFQNNLLKSYWMAYLWKHQPDRLVTLDEDKKWKGQSNSWTSLITVEPNTPNHAECPWYLFTVKLPHTAYPCWGDKPGRPDVCVFRQQTPISNYL